jgi:F0F1-type ATP synthase assembly protein I
MATPRLFFISVTIAFLGVFVALTGIRAQSPSALAGGLVMWTACAAVALAACRHAKRERS